MNIQARIIFIALISVLTGGWLLLQSQAVWADTTELKTLLTQMKASPRGPFSRIRWFCKDGEIFPPRPYACGEHGGGMQHGQLNASAKQLRAAGYRVANVLSAIDSAGFVANEGWRLELGQILLERFLIGYDDGWIFRGARFYRGALQQQDETAAANALVRALFDATDSSNQDFLLRREAYRLLPRADSAASLVSVRNLASKIAISDAGFAALRTKIHNLPDQRDAIRVREYARQQGLDALQQDYTELARLIEQAYSTEHIAAQLTDYVKSLKTGPLRSTLEQAATVLRGSDNNQQQRLELASRSLQQLRQAFARFHSNGFRRKTLELSLQLERQAFIAANRLADSSNIASRAQQLTWLASMIAATYGSGLISEREWQAARSALESLAKPRIALEVYRRELQYLNRLPGWADRWLRFHFSGAIAKLSTIEPLARQYIPDRLRSSPLLAYGRVLDGLLKDANRVSGVKHQLFGQSIGAGLRALNPGLARGRLQLPDEGKVKPQADNIVVLPETTSELPPVAGILTLGAGNALSHVQLLASNLGIPNVVISADLLSLIRPMQNRMVILAVSPGGIVQLEEDSPQWHDYFSRQLVPETGSIQPDMQKLDLTQHRLVSLAELRAADAGRISGPKAANLGELKYQFPDAVTTGLLIPFAVFREFLNQPYPGETRSVFEWMQSEYSRIKRLEPSRQAAASKAFLAQLRDWILNAEVAEDFRQRLSGRLRELFGEAGSYAVFVRSDTNVEDLPGFTGAGLNLTVPNVRGFENLLAAIRKVWASPFTDRAYAWRQNRMRDPEHVYPSVLLLKSVPVDKSGVMLTLDTQHGDPGKLTLAVNHGIGGAVQGQAAEELLVDPARGAVRLLADATAAKQRVLNAESGLVEQQLAADGQVLSEDEIRQLTDFARALSVKFPQRDEAGMPTAADVEFGFKQGQLVLFQVRPFLKNRRIKKNHYLNQLDHALATSGAIEVNMRETLVEEPGE